MYIHFFALKIYNMKQGQEEFYTNQHKSSRTAVEVLLDH